MKVRGATAVMQERATPSGGLDFFPTPPWATRAMLAELALRGWVRRGQRVLEPACGIGAMVRPLAELFGAEAVRATDIADWSVRFPRQDAVADFLDPEAEPVLGGPFDWVITNPPFHCLEAFATRALDLVAGVGGGVALLVRLGAITGGARWEKLFRAHPPALLLLHTERPVMLKGRLADPDLPRSTWSEKAGAYVTRRPTTATDYAWLVWAAGHAGNPPAWIPPGARARFTRPGDYLPEDWTWDA